MILFLLISVHIYTNTAYPLKLILHEGKSNEQWLPSTVIAHQGSTFIAHLKNRSKKIKHNFVIKDYNVSVKIKPDQNKNIRIKLHKSGTYAYECTLHNNHEKGHLVIFGNSQYY